MNFEKIVGPGALVTAAFIGPGTLTVCTLAGAGFGYELLWVLLFAIAATVLLQEMAARLGLVSQQGLGEALRSELQNPFLKTTSLVLVFTAIIVGNAAYEMGNITGAALGLEVEGFNHLLWGPIIIGAIVFWLLWKDNYKIIQYVLMILVIIMSVVFATTALLITNSMSEVMMGFIPKLTSDNQLMALGLIGTTIVPYNLFLHAATVSKKWKSTADIGLLRREMVVTIILGGLISMFVLITAASLEGGIIKGVSDMARQLEPLLGTFARPFMAIGLFSAGISSSLTAPLAASLTAKGIFGWTDEDQWKNRLVWGTILVLGVGFALAGVKPIAVIQIAQVANGILLPVVVIFLILMCNRSNLMGDWKNTPTQNVLGGFVILISIIISVRSFNSVFHFL
ncbi:MAG: divalent metal cation transporter [Cytophagales bacterium]|nr:divalent metal cation transporter [Cytophagales bacterium]